LFEKSVKLKDLYQDPGLLQGGSRIRIRIWIKVEVLYHLKDKIKGTVSVISTDPPCKDGNIRFATVNLKPW